MKKTVLGIITIVMLAVMMLSATPVNAASLSVDKDGKVEKDATVTVTVTVENEVDTMMFDVNYDNTKYTYVAKSATCSESGMIEEDLSEAGVVAVGVILNDAAAGATVTLKFTATEAGDATAFSVANAEYTKEGAEVTEPAATPVVLPVVDPAAEPTTEDPTTEDPTTEDPTTEDPTTDEPAQPAEEKPATDNTQTDNGKTYVDDNGKTITKLPQAGVYAPSIVLGVAMLAIASVVAYRIIKK